MRTPLLALGCLCALLVVSPGCASDEEYQAAVAKAKAQLVAAESKGDQVEAAKIRQALLDAAAEVAKSDGWAQGINAVSPLLPYGIGGIVSILGAEGARGIARYRAKKKLAPEPVATA